MQPESYHAEKVLEVVLVAQNLAKFLAVTR
jgi:hypothetical protein